MGVIANWKKLQRIRVSCDVTLLILSSLYSGIRSYTGCTRLQNGISHWKAPNQPIPLAPTDHSIDLKFGMVIRVVNFHFRVMGEKPLGVKMDYSCNSTQGWNTIS